METTGTFADEYLAGRVTMDDIDDYIDRWHVEGGKGVHLHTFLGITIDEYRNWVLDPDTLTAALDRARHRVEERVRTYDATGEPHDEVLRTRGGSVLTDADIRMLAEREAQRRAADEELAQKRRRARGDARFDDEGYQYGVAFHDGSIRAQWNGSTQRQRAEEEIERLREWLAKQLAESGRARAIAVDTYDLVRRRWGTGWRKVQDEPESQPEDTWLEQRLDELATDWMRNEEHSADYQNGLADAAEQLRNVLAAARERSGG